MENKRNWYLGDPNLPTVDSTFEYTPEMVEEIEKCSKDILYFAQNYFYIVTLGEGKKKIELYKPQKRIIKKLANNRFVVVCASRQSGKTTMMTIYALWLVCFHSDKRVLIVANREETAVFILRRIRTAYEQLPNWLKPPVKQYGKTEVIYGNDSSISISSTTGTAARGESCNCVTGDGIITIRDKETKETFDINMKDLARVLEKNEQLSMVVV